MTLQHFTASMAAHQLQLNMMPFANRCQCNTLLEHLFAAQLHSVLRATVCMLVASWCRPARRARLH